MAFHILSLTGGGYRGLFTIEVLARLEQQAGRPIGTCFDLIAGTSIGGVIAIGLAVGKTAAEIKQVFIDQGETIFPPRWQPHNKWANGAMLATRLIAQPKYDGTALRKAITDVVGADTDMQHATTRLLIPTINMTTGKVHMFKTPHHRDLVGDGGQNAVDVAMATSAAPLYYPLAKIGDCYFADGGLAANAPDSCAIYEALRFCGAQGIHDLRLLSIGTTTAHFALPVSLGGDLGAADWLERERILSTVFSAPQQLVDFVVGHQLEERYLRIDADPSPEEAEDLGFDVADAKARGTLLGLADSAFQNASKMDLVRMMLQYVATPCAFRA